jgi:SOS-response transcriptional repressor LexA
MENLTRRQKEIIEFIVQHTFENLYQPTLREIGERFSIASTNAVMDHLKALRRKGYLGEQSKTRAFYLTDKALRLVKCSDHLRARPIILPEVSCGSQ